MSYLNSIIKIWAAFHHIYMFKDHKDFFKPEVVNKIEDIENLLSDILEKPDALQYIIQKIRSCNNVLGLELFDIFFNTVFLKILRGSPSFTLDKMQELHHLVGELVEIEQKTNLDVSIPYQQYKMNVLIGGNAWRLNPKMNYINAIIDESGEFLGSTGYEWWKAKQLSPKDEMNQITEYIDIYHFLLSLSIKCLGVEDTEKIIASIVKESTNNEFVHFDKYDYLAQVLKSSAGVHLTLKRLDLALFGGEGDKKLMDFSNECTKRDIQNFLNIGERFQNIMKNELIDAFRGFFSLGKKLNLTVEETDNLYILKYALNVTRKNNGYKEGTYNKEWRSLAGMVEDNYIVFGEKDKFDERVKTLEDTKCIFEAAVDFVQELYDTFGKTIPEKGSTRKPRTPRALRKTSESSKTSKPRQTSKTSK